MGLDSISLNLYSVCVPNKKPKDLCIYSTGLWINRPEIFKLEILYLVFENTLITKLDYIIFIGTTNKRSSRYGDLPEWKSQQWTSF